ncbi:MAG TPA: ABC transporter permease [Candidatus Acidoferrales bacterium]|jgi:putative ABC transport system permease protein|nr:ABC transporter permease [Candidatus Acidoferrales bacterium]
MRMALGENARMAFDTLHQNKSRSFLTVLGVVIGVTTLIAVSSVLVGLDASIRDYLSEFGSDTIFIFKFNPGIATRRTPEELNRRPLTIDDAMAIKADCPSVMEVDAQGLARITGPFPPTASARYEGREVSAVNYRGNLPTAVDVYSFRFLYGRYFTEAENERRSDVAVIGYDVYNSLFLGENPLGKEVQVSGTLYTIIGVLDKRKGGIVGGQSVDVDFWVPYRTYRKHNPQDDEVFIAAAAYPGEVSQAEDEITGVLRRTRKLAYNAPDNFGMSSAQEIADQFRQIVGSIAGLIIAVSSVGLLIGGVGVMNIMLMSVTQRTREIGVRKAIGARRRDIIWQFLTEAVSLTGAGGLVGVGLGWGSSRLMRLLLPSLPSAVPLWAVILAVAVSMSVGLFFGMYPAIKAARLDPVDALRYE